MTTEPERPRIQAQKAESIAPRRIEVRTGEQPADQPKREAMERNAEPVTLPAGPYRPIEDRGDAAEVTRQVTEEGE